MMSLLRTVLQAVLVVAFVGGALWGVKWMIETKPTAPQKAREEPVYAVEAALARAADNQPHIRVFGEVAARRAVELRSLVAGPVIEVNPKLIVGERLAKGALLVRIDPFSYEGAVTEAEANLAEAEAKLAESKTQLAASKTELGRLSEQVAIAERDLERAKQLVQSRSVAERTVDERALTLVQRRQQLEAGQAALEAQEARVRQQEANLARLRWRLRQAQRDLADTELRAPYDAVVRSENVGVGKRLGVNDVVAQLYEADALDVRFTLSDSQYGRLKADADALLGRKTTVSWAVGDAPITAEAVIDRIGPDVSSASGGVSVIAVVSAEDAAALRPGAFVTVGLRDRGFPNSHRLPETALYDGDHVYVLLPVEEAEDAAAALTPEPDPAPGAAQAAVPAARPDTSAKTPAFTLARRPARPLAWDGDDVLLSGALDGLWVMTSHLAEAGDGVKVRPVVRIGADGPDPDPEAESKAQTKAGAGAPGADR